jgi:hypothetical protein
VYNRDVVFREVEHKFEFEVVQIKKNTEKVRFEVRNEEDDSNESTESDEEMEQPTSVVRRSK